MGNPRNHSRMNLAVAVLVTMAFSGRPYSHAAGEEDPPKVAVQTSSQAKPLPLSAATAELIQPEDLVKILHASGDEKPLILHVGFRMLYTQAHIPGAEYIGATSKEPGIAQLRRRMAAVPKDRFIVLYCGCCPWGDCPNVAPAYKELRALGFSQVKVLYLASNLGADWVRKGYPVAKGE